MFCPVLLIRLIGRTPPCWLGGLSISVWWAPPRQLGGPHLLVWHDPPCQLSRPCLNSWVDTALMVGLALLGWLGPTLPDASWAVPTSTVGQ